MPPKTYKIVVAYRTETYTVRYWPGGYGRRVDGYVTSLSQLREHLCKRVNKRTLDLYCVDGFNLRPLITTQHLNNEVSHVRHRRSLCVVAYDPGKCRHFHPLQGVKNYFNRVVARIQDNWFVCNCNK